MRKRAAAAGAKRVQHGENEAEGLLRQWAEAASTSEYDQRLHNAVARCLLRAIQRPPGPLDPFDIDLA